MAKLHLFVNIGWLQDEPRAAWMVVKGKRPAGLHLRVPMAGQKPCIQIVMAIHLLQASHIEMRYLNFGQNLCTLQFNVMSYYCMINVFQVVAC